MSEKIVSVEGSGKKEVVVLEGGWKLIERELKVRKGNGSWWQVEMSGRKFIMKEVDSHVELVRKGGDL